MSPCLAQACLVSLNSNLKKAKEPINSQKKNLQKVNIKDPVQPRDRPFLGLFLPFSLIRRLWWPEFAECKSLKDTDMYDG
jgi:hypothetical protein